MKWRYTQTHMNHIMNKVYTNMSKEGSDYDWGKCNQHNLTLLCSSRYIFYW